MCGSVCVYVYVWVCGSKCGCREANAHRSRLVRTDHLAEEVLGDLGPVQHVDVGPDEAADDGLLLCLMCWLWV